MKITFIGTASGLSVTDRAHASLLIETGAHYFLIDCGEGAVRSLLMQNIDPNDISAIVISHTHPDHCAGIPTLMQYMHLTEREKPLNIYLPKGVSSAFRKYFDQLYLLNEKLTFDYRMNDYTEGLFWRGDNLSIEAVPNLHLEHYSEYVERYRISAASFSFVFVEGAQSIYYSADLKGMVDLKPPSRADLMIVECTHIGVEEALKLAADKGIKRVIFTHIPPEMDTTNRSFEGITGEFAYDGMGVIV